MSHLIIIDDVNPSWSAYRRNKRLERNQRMSVIIVSIGLVAGLLLVACSFVVKVRRDAAERKALIEAFGGVE